ncbi:hypothetical protein [Streptomyces sp. NBC_01236]|uniref:hypothetical protein n=1 Tax=Streptomyces sp. NBC_01236 TaxID=2903789 RepID=UPI002E14C217|nr:hypothetical protein OG324_49390 [Streptomyces sp. NBC_01236]
MDEIGLGTDIELKIGGRVMTMAVAYTATGGTYAEYLVLDPRQVAIAPVGSSHVEAATVLPNGLTVRQALDLLSPTAGAGRHRCCRCGGRLHRPTGEGRRLAGGGRRGSRGEDLVRSLGADRVVARGVGMAERIREAAPAGVSSLVDAALMGPSVLPDIQLVMGRSSDCLGSPRWATPGTSRFTSRIEVGGCRRGEARKGRRPPARR